MDHALLWEPDRPAEEELLTLGPLPDGTRYLVLASHDSTIDAPLIKHGFVDTGVRLEDGGHVLVQRRAA